MHVRFRIAGGAAAVVAAAVLLAACNSSNTAVPANAVTVASSDNLGKPTGKPSGNSAIPILVNDVPITSYDISQRAKLMRLGGGKSSDSAAQDELINETLEMLEAQRRGVNVPQPQVDAAFASIAGRLKMSPAQFSNGLASEGVSSDTLKKRLRAQIAWAQLVQQRTATKASVKNADIQSMLTEKGDPTSMTISEFTLQQIVFVVPTGSSAGAYVQRRNEAQAFRQSFPGCDQSLDKAKKLRGVVVKDIGRRDSTQLQGKDGEEIQKTPVGKTAPPVQTNQGIELIAVCASRSVQSTSAARNEVENSLYLKQAESLGADYLKELRDRAIIEYR
ncbi:MAG TPA: peptidylprolyl isomerase [Bauldia sp.]|nr:peptidylprolyl isomerase [Bauldia sp.]